MNALKMIPPFVEGIRSLLRIPGIIPVVVFNTAGWPTCWHARHWQMANAVADSQAVTRRA